MTAAFEGPQKEQLSQFWHEFFCKKRNYEKKGDLKMFFHWRPIITCTYSY